MKKGYYIFLVNVYRKIVFPIIKLKESITTKLICEQNAYFDHKTEFEGSNIIGRNTFLSETYLGYGTYVAERSSLLKSKVGRYTSIGCGVQTAIGRHPVNQNISTSPYFYSSSQPNNSSYYHQNDFHELKYAVDQYCVDIGNDVWIGAGVTILDGVVIGNGAVIGAGSVVVKDIPPYSVNVGNPSKIIKYRFEKEEIELLQNSKWWTWSVIKLQENAALFSKPKEFLKFLEKENEKDVM